MTGHDAPTILGPTRFRSALTRPGIRFTAVTEGRDSLNRGDASGRRARLVENPDLFEDPMSTIPPKANVLAAMETGQ